MRSQVPSEESNFSEAACKEMTERTKEILEMVVTKKLREFICLFPPHLKIKRKDTEHQITFLLSLVTANYIMPKWQLM